MASELTFKSLPGSLGAQRIGPKLTAVSSAERAMPRSVADPPSVTQTANDSARRADRLPPMASV